MLKKLFKKTQPSPEFIQPSQPADFVETESTVGTLPDRLDGLLSLLPESVWVCEGKEITDSTPLWISPASPFVIPGGSSDTATLGTLCSLVNDEDKAHFRHFLRNAHVHTPPDAKLKCRIITSDGRYEWFQVAVRRERSSDGQIQRLTGIMLNVSDDVTRESEYDIVMTRFSLSREMLNDGLWDLQIINGDPLHPNNVFWWSPQFRKLLGFETVEEFPDVIDSWASRLHPDDSQHTLDAFIKHLNDHSGATGYDVEYRVKLKNGNYRWFRARGQTRRDKDGVPLRAVGALIDIQTLKDQDVQAGHERQRRDEAAASVSEIADLVSENANIAAQIKLISLNASIEAARAGVQGRGFSVIASEIRELADRTAEITENISRLQIRLDASSRL
ncbi:PAS domain-containing protein [Pantoea vagans]|uniref:methyl-accepting chemotaxis protein n=1 Tax=Pantoea vagans TaxID=470934 RepID=UPI00225748B4|nr:PAS domain-containing protein [Pantoea vagans]MCX3311002.1 PAS domain-containing protein [Pantoea vagans]